MRDVNTIDIGHDGDTSISKVSAGVVGIGNGTSGDVSGTLSVAAINLNGSAISGAVSLKTGGVANGSQVLLDLTGSTNVAITDSGTGPVTIAVPGPLVKSRTAITADGAVNPNTAKDYVVTKGSAALLTLAAPTVTTDDGKRVSVASSTGFAHTLTATGLLNTGSAAVNLATFAAFAGAGLTLEAYQGEWLVIKSVGVTFS